MNSHHLSSLCCRQNSFQLNFVRTLLRPPRNLPYRGIYRTDGEVVRQGELLVCQYKLNYHPGLNVSLHRQQTELLLKSNVDGRVVISQEKVDPDLSNPECAEYVDRKGIPIYKLTFNVVPLEMSRSFRLINTI
ncbi:hypothetical protein AB6A40_010858 [Gnathostoma spinigerum]|uniref:39S ribosomal protein L27, mitochondrial n=1 Tax=Gnathostoma spinigerum TaxID=75299 RepID=A0ABD6EW24_9BILA